MVASDSRWSYEFPGNDDEFLFVDNTGFNKIAARKDFCFVFAGNGKLMQLWKDWLRVDPLPLMNLPPFGVMVPGGKIVGVAICMVQRPSGKVWMQKGTIKSGDDAVFAGTGAEAAKVCWESNKCAKTAVKSASMSDLFSGGHVKHMAVSNGAHNLGSPAEQMATIDVVDEALKQRGCYMDVKTKTAVPIEQSPRGQALLKIVTTQSTASAPTGVDVEWTDDDIEEFRGALQRAVDQGLL